jgi:hypothetical protein
MPLELLVVIVLALVAGIWLVARQQNLRLRQIQHRERLALLDKGLREGQPPPHEGEQPMSDTMTQWKDPGTYINWFRLSTLGLAFLLTFGGVGMLTALLIVEDPELRKLWSIGLIPIMTGFGLFLFWRMTTVLMRKEDD